MQVSDLQRAFSSVTKMLDSSLYGSEFVRCHNGTLQYLARTSFVQIDNHVTQELPDFLIHYSDFQRLTTWLNHLNNDSAVHVEKRANVIVVSCSINSEFDTTAVITLPIHKHERREYADIEETVLKEVINNDYFFYVPQEIWRQIMNTLGVVISPAVSDVPLVHMLIVDNVVTMRVITQLGATKQTFKIYDYHSPAKLWEGNFAVEALSTQFDGWEKVKISYSENTNKVLSPLLIEYNSNVKQVCAPSWKRPI